MDLERQVKLKNAYCQAIIDLGFSYDGFNAVDSLKGLIDELVLYAQRAVECDDKGVMYIDGEGRHRNILGEEVK